MPRDSVGRSDGRELSTTPVDTRARRAPQNGTESVVERIAVVGLGPRGVETTLAFARAGYRVLTCDLEETSAREGLREGPWDELRRLLDDGRVELPDDPVDAVAVSDLVVVADTASKETQEGAFLRAASQAIGRGLTRGAVVCCDDAPPQDPGGLDFLARLEEESGLKAPAEFGVACRLRMGTANGNGGNGHRTQHVIAGLDERSCRVACEAYGRALAGTIREMPRTLLPEAERMFRDRPQRMVAID